jgi:hypothetical protein
MGISSKRSFHLGFLRERKDKTRAEIKKYVEEVWLPKAEEILGLELRIRYDRNYYAILIKGRKHKNILAFIDKKTGEIMRPKNPSRPHLRYQPKAIKSNINDKDGGLRYVRNVRFRYLP